MSSTPSSLPNLDFSRLIHARIQRRDTAKKLGSTSPKTMCQKMWDIQIWICLSLPFLSCLPISRSHVSAKPWKRYLLRYNRPSRVHENMGECSKGGEFRAEWSQLVMQGWCQLGLLQIRSWNMLIMYPKWFIVYRDSRFLPSCVSWNTNHSRFFQFTPTASYTMCALPS